MRRPAEHSALEGIYSKRAGKDLVQFGYDIVGNGGAVSGAQIGAIQDDYILGQGDTVNVTLRGQENATYEIVVDRDGNVTLPRLRPISAGGRRFDDFRNELNAAIRQGYLQTQAYITMGQVRQISVNVVGEVENPGVYQLSGLSSLLDALNAAGGVRKSGSLRKIVIDRSGKAASIDLYKFISQEALVQNVSLRQGDRVVVTPLGPTVAVAGDIRRPGIYELPPGASGTSVRSVLLLGNGYAIRGKYRLTVLRTQRDGTQRYEDSTSRPGAFLSDGEVLFVDAAANFAGGNVTLAGNARLPGVYALNRTPTLHDLLPNSQALLPLTYMPFGFILREDPKSLKRGIVPFSVQLLMEGKYNAPLQSRDEVHILTFTAMRSVVSPLPTLPQPARGMKVGPGTTPEVQTASQTVPGIPGAQSFAAVDTRSTSTTQVPATLTGSAAVPPAESSAFEGLTTDEAAAVGLLASDYRVTLDGAVRQPGDYLAVPGVPLDEVIDAAGGLTPEADLNFVEITSEALDNVAGTATTSRKLYNLTPQTLASVSLRRRDVVQIPTIPTDQQEGSMTVAGEVRFPGTYHLLKGERLSSVLQRAGGLTAQSYPIGAVFQRPAIAGIRQAAYQREADDLQKQLIASVAQGGNALAASTGTQGGLSAEAATFVAGVITQLRTKQADGRMSIIADPAALAANPEADIELQPGDQLLVPKRPSEVDVTGEVLNAGSFRFSANLDAADYIGLAGGYDRYADDDHIYIVQPDGTSRRISDDLFNFAPTKLAPGSVIVVPRDLRPLDLGILTVTVSKVLADFAISAASLAVISRSN